MIYQMAPVFIPIIWNKRFLAASAVKRLSLEIATPAGQSIQSLALVMQNAKIATVKTSVLTVGKTPSPFPCGFSFLYVGGKEFIGEKDRRKPEQSKTLLQLVSEGYHLHIRGHWGDGQIIPGTPSKCRTWWNDPDNFTLIDLMTLNKFLLTNQK